MAWTAEQILSLAPDASVAKAGKALAAARKWHTLARSADAIWGEIKGSGKAPYQTQIDLTGPAYKCTCPSHKRPCKHALALFLLFEAEAQAFAERDLPDWVSTYLASRAKRAQAAKEKPKPVADSAAQADRQAERMAKVSAGLAELDLWLRDLLRSGLAAAPQRPSKFWREMAARLVDAQAPGLARLVNDLENLPASGEGWQDRLLERLGNLYLLIEGFRRIDALPPDTQADVRTLIGWTQAKADAAGLPGRREPWAVVGRRTLDEDGLRTQRTWLWGTDSLRPALVLDFAVSGQPFETNLFPGTLLEAEVVFFPSAYPVRAVLRERELPAPLPALHGYASIEAALAGYAGALARNPWLETLLLVIQGLTPAQSLSGWAVTDSAGSVLPLTPRFDSGWPLLAVSGGHPVTVSGEWDGNVFLPMGVWGEGRFVTL